MKLININAVWCPACIIMHKTWNSISDLTSDFEIINYDYDIDEDEIEEFNVGTTLPVTIIIKDENEITRIIGEKTKEELIKIIEEVNK